MQQPRLTLLFPAITFAVLGTVLSAILLVQHQQAEEGNCGSAGCVEVLSSRWATFPPAAESQAAGDGVPVALLGVVYFLAIALWLSVVGRLSWQQRLWHSLPMGVALVGGLVSIALVAGMAFLETWCPLCLAVHAMNLAMVPYIVLLRPERDGSEADTAPVSLRPILTGVALAACAAAAAWFGYDSWQYRQRSEDLSHALARASAGATVPGERADAPSTFTATKVDTSAVSEWVVESDKPDADTVVVYTDLQCPACRVFEQRLLNDIAPKFNGYLRVSLKHYPLCAECNEGMSNMHPYACEAAYLAEAARLQGGTKALLAVLHAIPPRRTRPWSEEDVIELALEASLNPQKLLETWQSDEVRQRVKQDIASAKKAGVIGTPSVFVNGLKIDSKVRDLPEYWEQLASRSRDPNRNTANLAANSTTAPQQTARPDRPATPKEASAAATAPAPKPSQDKQTRVASSMLSIHDANKDGVLDPKEWAKLYGDGSKIDTNGDQRITVDEIRAGIVDIQGGHEEPAPAGKSPTANALNAAAPTPKKTAEEPRLSTIFEGDELDIRATTMQGGTFDLKEQRGKPVLAVFWASWCSHCIDETADLLRLYRKYHEQGLEIVGISADISEAAAREFVERNNIPWPQIQFEESQRGRANPLSRKYNIRGYPSVFLIDAEGVTRGVHLRGRKIEEQLAALLKVEPTPEAEAAAETKEIAATFYRPTNSPREAEFQVKAGDRMQIAGPTTDGGYFDMAEHAGKPILVAFWASWCPHCKKELPTIKEVYERYKDKGLVVVGVSTDRKKADLDNYLASNPLPWKTIFYDVDGMRAFNSPLVYWHGIHSVPALFLLDGEGKVTAVKPRGPAIDREVAAVFGVEPAPAKTASPAAELIANLLGTKKPDAAEATQAAKPPTPVPTPAAAPPAAKKKSNFDSTPAPVLAHGIIQRYDTNQDGILQKPEWARLPASFVKYDTDEDGTLTAEELGVAIAVAKRLKETLPSITPPKTP